MPYGITLHLPPTNFSQPLKKQKQGQSLSLEKKSVKKFLESRQESGPKTEKRRRQNEQQDKAKIARDQTERWNQMIALRFKTGGRHQKSPPLFRPKERKSLRVDFESIKYR